MKYIFVAPGLTEPTHETLETYSKKMFKKILRLLDERETESILRISAQKDGDEFVVTADLSGKESVLSKESNRDLRRAIEKVSTELKSLLAKNKDKNTRVSSEARKIKDLIREETLEQA